MRSPPHPESTDPQSEIRPQGLYKKTYFQIAIGAPLALLLISSLIILNSTNLEFSGTAQGLTNFVEIFKIPITLSAVTLALFGASSSYYRGELSYQQIQVQMRQHLVDGFEDFRNEFLEILADYKHENKILLYEPRAVFDAIYPEARKGHRQLCKRFAAHIKEVDQVSCNPGIINCLKPMVRGINTTARDDFAQATYSPSFESIVALTAVAPIEISKRHWGRQEPGKLSPEALQEVIEMCQEALVLIGAVNTFEAHKFLNFSEFRTLHWGLIGMSKFSDCLERIQKFENDPNSKKFLDSLKVGESGDIEFLSEHGELLTDPKAYSHLHRKYSESLKLPQKQSLRLLGVLRGDFD